MIKTYALAVQRPVGFKALRFPPMTLAQAEYWRDVLAQAGKHVFVINLNAE